MELTHEDLAEFQRLYAEEFRETISLEEAREMASRLLQLYEILACPPATAAADALDVTARSAVRLEERSKPNTGIVASRDTPNQGDPDHDPKLS